jgi:hypothetical protein
MAVKSDASGLDGISLSFVEWLLPVVLPVLKHLLNFMFTLLYYILYFIIWIYNQNLVKACLRRSLHCALSRARFIQSRAIRALLHLFMPSAICLPWYLLPSSTVLARLSVVGLWPNVAQSIALDDADDIWAVEFPIQFEIVPDPVHTV